MVILGLGSNVGDRLTHLREALLAIKQITGIRLRQVSPLYLSDALLPENAPDDWNQPFINLAVSLETALSPEELYVALKQIEKTIGRDAKPPRWAPRVIDIDILAWGKRIIHTDTLTIPHKGLSERPFAFWPLADVAPFWLHEGKTAAQWVEQWGSRFSGEAPFHTRQIPHRIDMPSLVGTLNITPDSFSDGNRFVGIDQAIQQAMLLVNSGASILDIGAESTSPAATAITPEIEWQRLQPVLEAVCQVKTTCLIPPKISIDTRHASTAEKALQYPIDWINDVSGLDDPAMQQLIKASDVDCVIMHHIKLPEDRAYVLPRDQDPVKLVHAWGKQRLQALEKAGIDRKRLIFDVGIGFGKMAEQSFALLKNIAEFSSYGTRLLVGHSRKSLFNLQTARPSHERDIETTAVSLMLANQPIDYLRVHNVDMTARAFKVAAVF